MKGNLFVVMGVSGCGKSTVAHLLAVRTGGLFLDADDFHSAEAKELMAAGIALSDGDRWPWLTRLNSLLRNYAGAEEPVFMACSALRQDYRDKLAEGLESLQFIYLKGTKEVIRKRLANRKNHFMNPGLLDSQFATLEEPLDAITLSITDPMEVIINTALEKMDSSRESVRNDGEGTKRPPRE